MDTMTKEQLKDLRLAQKNGDNSPMTQEQFADLMGVEGRTIRRWESGESVPRGKAVHRKIAELQAKVKLPEKEFSGAFSKEKQAHKKS